MCGEQAKARVEYEVAPDGLRAPEEELTEIQFRTSAAEWPNEAIVIQPQALCLLSDLSWVNVSRIPGKELRPGLAPGG